VSSEPLVPRLLAGPAFEAGAERYVDHLGRIGHLPPRSERRILIGVLEASGLLGRGGAGFPVGTKWRSVAERGHGSAVVLVNGAEGEPLSRKDQALMSLRPHLVLDGAELAAETVGAEEIVLYVGTAHKIARNAIRRAVAERAAAPGRAARTGERRLSRARAVPVRMMLAPDRYVAGEESAAVNFVNQGDARPYTTPPRPYDRGVRGQPTLIQNVESLAHAALIARFGADWYRQAGRGQTRGTALVTTSAFTGRTAVREVELGVTVGDIAQLVGPAANRENVQAVLLGGYFGGWMDAGAAWNIALDPGAMRASGWSFGCGIVGFLSKDACPVSATAWIADYMAGQSAAQCGPCVFGLRSIADATIRIARLTPFRDDLANLERWAGQVRNRGACRHPDGAVGLLTRGLEAFGAEFQLHQRSGRCSRSSQATLIERVA
jgi:NADH:ubiquinone oxidoreductase subunit F (NADH-binding)